MSRIFFETTCFIAFLLIAHGYCVMHEQLSLSERRGIAGLASLLYLTLTGYKAAVPQFAVSLSVRSICVPVFHDQQRKVHGIMSLARCWTGRLAEI